MKHWITLVNCSSQLTKHWHWPNCSTFIDHRLDWWHWCTVTFKLALVWSIVLIHQNTVLKHLVKMLSVTQLLIAFLNLISVVTHAFCPSLSDIYLYFEVLIFIYILKLNNTVFLLEQLPNSVQFQFGRVPGHTPEKDNSGFEFWNLQLNFS